MLPVILIIASVFAFLLGRLASAHLKHKQREVASSDWSDVNAASLASELERLHSAGDTM